MRDNQYNFFYFILYNIGIFAVSEQIQTIKKLIINKFDYLKRNAESSGTLHFYLKSLYTHVSIFLFLTLKKNNCWQSFVVILLWNQFQTTFPWCTVYPLLCSHYSPTWQKTNAGAAIANYFLSVKVGAAHWTIEK